MGGRTKEHATLPAPEIGDALAHLRRTFRGELLGPDDHRYDDARRVHNAMVDLRPRLIARCRGTADVAATVAFSRENGLDLSVRAGGHSIGYYEDGPNLYTLAMNGGASQNQRGGLTSRRGPT